MSDRPVAEGNTLCYLLPSLNSRKREIPIDTLTLIYFIAGFALLLGGAEVLVRGATRLAAVLGISPLVIGLTVVAFGTSSPELAVTTRSVWAGQSDIALGNVVGSNICNTLLILGLAAMITPLAVSQKLLRLDVPLMIGLSFLILLMGLDGRISRLDGAILFAGIIIYTIWSIRQSRRENHKAKQTSNEAYGSKSKPSPKQLFLYVTLIVIGLALLTIGSNWLVEGAVVLARIWGVSELIIGLTIIAIGTSLPEIATSLVAALRDEGDIAVGNVIGSNIFNILSVLGLTGLISPNGVDVSDMALRFDIPVMIAVAVACLPIFFNNYKIDRWEGSLFFGYYLAYALYLILNATQNIILPTFVAAMVYFVIPLTIITLITLTVRAIRINRRSIAQG